MSKKFGKFLLFSALAGAAVYGAYHYLQSKDCAPSKPKNDDSDDDLNDFNEDLDDDVPPTKDRSYVSLNIDKAEAFASEAFQKAKEVITDSVQQVKETVKSVTENQGVVNGNFTDITNVHSDDVVKKDEKPFEVPQETVQSEQAASEPVSEQMTEESEPVSEQTVEEFFNDEN